MIFSKIHKAYRALLPHRLRYFLSIVVILNLPAIPGAAISAANVLPPASIDAAALVRRAVQNRLDADKSPQPFRYLLHKASATHDTTKEIIETRNGDVARLIAIDGKPLSGEADREELDRLENLAKHPELQEHRRKQEQKDAERVDRLMALLPDAFLYRLEGIAPCGAGRCYRLSFTPNPDFVPPDLEARFLRGVAGETWIDQAKKRMTRLDAHLVSNVDFGFGILAKLDKGGTVQIAQSNVHGDEWELTRLEIHVTGKALLVKSIHVNFTEEASHFSPVPADLNYRQAIQLLTAK